LRRIDILIVCGHELQEMGGKPMDAYGRAVEQHMVALYNSLSEKDRRRYAAVEAEKLGHGGVQYVSELFACDPDTVRQGYRDVETLPADEAAGRIRKKGRSQES
jgi:hypothetical protein